MTNEKGVAMLQQIAEYYGITKNSDFAKFFGLSIQTSFQRLKNGFVDFEQIYEKCPDISPDWLLSGGEGPMLRADRGDASDRTAIAAVTEDKSAGQIIASLQQALDKEQTALANAQSQIGSLIDILRTERK